MSGKTITNKFSLTAVVDGKDMGRNLLRNAGDLTPTAVKGGGMSLVRDDGDTTDTYQGRTVSHFDNGGGSAYKDVLSWLDDASVIEKGGTYTMSFLCKGTGALQVFLYSSSTGNVSDLAIYRVGDDGAAATKNDGNWAVSLSGTWARRHVTWRVDSEALPQRVLIRATAGSEVYVCQPKLEEGGDATAFCLNEADLVGNGIAEVTEHYLASASKTGVTTSTDGWTADPADAAISYSKPYLWNYETVTYTDGTTADTAPSLIGSYGGKGISKITEYYLATNSTTAPTDGWQTTVQQVTSDNKYLWNYELVTYTDGSTDKTDPAIIGTYGSDGTGYATNLLLNSANFDAAPPTHWETWGGGVTALSLERIDGENCLAMSLTGDTEHYGGVMQTRVDKAYFRSGDKVALGFDAKGGTSGTQTIAFIIHFRPVGGSTVTAQVYRTLTVDSVMRRYTFAFDVPSAVTGTAGFCLMLGNTPSTGAKSVTIGRVKLEANTAASPWSPNPEDLRGPQGDKGDDAVVMVMDNEADSVPCDSAGVVTEATEITTRVWLYKGAKPITSGITAPTDGGITLGGKTDTVKETGDGGYALTWSFAKGDTITGGDRQAATVTLGYGNATYTSIFTLNVVRSGAAGVSPTLYRLMPSLTALSFARDSDGNLTPKSLTLSCGFSETKDGVTTSYAGTDDRVTSSSSWSEGIVAYRLLRSDGTTDPKSWYNMWNQRTGVAGLTYTYNEKDPTQNTDKKGILEIAADSDITAVEFVYAKPSGTTIADSDIIDRETVPVVREGAKGADITKIGEEIRYIRSASGTETPGENAEWSTDIPPFDNDTPYLWTRSTINFSSGNSVVSYSVARQAKDGDNGKALLVSSVTRYAKDGKPSTDDGYKLTDFPNVSEGETVWSITITTYTDPDSKKEVDTTRSYGCYRIGKDGDKGAGVHIAYATNVTGTLNNGYPTNDNQVTGFSTTYFSGAVWIGVCVSTDTDDPQDKKLYQWSRMRGENGKDGTSVTMQGSAYGVDCLGLVQNDVFTPDQVTAKEGMTALDYEGEDDGVATRACILKYTGGAWEVQEYLDAGVYVLDKNGKVMYLVEHDPNGETEYDTRASSYTPTTAEGFLVDGDLWFYSVAQQAWTDAGTIQGPQGPQGPKGNTGGTGRGISSVDVIYCLDNNDGSAPSKPTVAAYSTTEWNTDPSTFVKSTNESRSLWQCTRTEYTDGTASYTTPQKVGDIGDMATVTELYTSVEDGGTPTAPNPVADASSIDRGGWKEAGEGADGYEPVKGQWTWTCSEIVWLAADDNNYMVTYTEPQKASYTPNDGESLKGEDAVVLDTSPAAIVWNEKEGSVTYNTTNNQYEGTPKWPEIPIVVAVRTGGVAQAGWTFEPSIVSGSYLFDTVTEGTYTDSDGNEATVQTNEVVYILHDPKKVTGSSELWTNGSFRVRATKDGKELVKNIPIALNALGTWKLNVVNDSMTATSGKTIAYTDGKVTELQSQITENADGIKSKVSQTDYDTDKKATETRMTTIEQTATDIKATVKKNDSVLASLGMSEDGIETVGKKVTWRNSDEGEELLRLSTDGLMFKGTVYATGGEFAGTVRASNFFHRVCVWGTSKGRTYYVAYTAEEAAAFKKNGGLDYPYTPGAYITDDDVTAAGDENTGLVKCTGYADIVIVLGGLATNADGYREVMLPRAADMEGKIVELYDGSYNPDSDSQLDVKAVDGGNFTFGINSGTNGGIDSMSSPPVHSVISAGSYVRFYSIEISGTYYWLELEHKTNKTNG